MQKIARQLGRYHVLDRIAFGGMAEIFRALTFDEHGAARMVAIKQVLPHYAEDREFIDMLVDEAKLVSMLRHPNIIEIYEVGHVDGFYFLAMEHVWGKDLRAVLERCRAWGTRVPVEVSAYLLSEALAGLDTAHRLLDPYGNPAGLVHRDFSPSNILISYDGDIKICDFGIAKATFSRIETKTGVIKGKVKYMSPEQAFGRKLDHRSDLFSAGSVFYEMLTNEAPFAAKNEIDLIFLVRDAQIIPPSKRISEIPTSLEEVIYKSMARSRSARFQSAAEFRYGLTTYLRQRGLGNWRAELGRFMRFLYGKELLKERQGLSEYILDPTRIGHNLGQNLIADVLGQNAAYTKFNPFPTKAFNPATAQAVHDASTQILNVPDGYEPKDLVGRGVPITIDDQATVILKIPDDQAFGEEEQTTLWSRLEEFVRSTTAEEPRLAGAPPDLPDDSRSPTRPPISGNPPALPPVARSVRPTLKAFAAAPPVPQGYTPPPPQASPLFAPKAPPPLPSRLDRPRSANPFSGDISDSAVSTLPNAPSDGAPEVAAASRVAFVEAETQENISRRGVTQSPAPPPKTLDEELDEFPTQIAESSQPESVHSEDTHPTHIASTEQETVASRSPRTPDTK